jgi:hypothetical protein
MLKTEGEQIKIIINLINNGAAKIDRLTWNSGHRSYALDIL